MNFSALSYGLFLVPGTRTEKTTGCLSLYLCLRTWDNGIRRIHSGRANIQEMLEQGFVHSSACHQSYEIRDYWLPS